MRASTGWRAAALAASLLPALASGSWAQAAGLNVLTDQLVAANRILYKQGIVDGFGHVSFRHPDRHDRYFMSQSVAPGRVTKTTSWSSTSIPNRSTSADARSTRNASSIPRSTSYART